MNNVTVVIATVGIVAIIVGASVALSTTQGSGTNSTSSNSLTSKGSSESVNTTSSNSNTTAATTSILSWTTSLSSGQIQIVFYVVAKYSGNWTGSFTYYRYQGSTTNERADESFYGSGDKNETVIFPGNFNDGLCVSAMVQKYDSSNNTIFLQIYTPTYNFGSHNETGVAYGIVSVNICTSVYSP